MENNSDIKSTFDRLLTENNMVFIVPHNRADLDAIGSAIGIALICKKFEKKHCIVINDIPDQMDPITRKIFEKIKGKFEVIHADAVPELLTDKSLMVAVDTNSTERISTTPYLDRFNAVMVIDHHKADEQTIKTPYLFIDGDCSSTCEKVTDLLDTYEVEVPNDCATYLLAGIILDTGRFGKNTGSGTYAAAATLTKKGADNEAANNLFLEDFEKDRARQRLIDGTDFTTSNLTLNFAIACGKDDKSGWLSIEDIASAAEYMLNFKVNATFAIARIDEDTVSISARRKSAVDVSAIMKLFGGGGSEHSAAARVKGLSISEVKEALIKILVPGPTFTQGDVVIQNDLETQTEEDPNGFSMQLKQ